MADWHEKVYRKVDRLKDTREFRRLRPLIFQRDKSTCQSCLAKLQRFRGQWSIHHIVPRDEGGLDVKSNLILLCHRCHDLIEPLRLSRVEIHGYLFKQKYGKKTGWRTDWQSWVYGGEQNPYMDPLFLERHANHRLVAIGDYWWEIIDKQVKILSLGV